MLQIKVGVDRWVGERIKKISAIGGMIVPFGHSTRNECIEWNEKKSNLI
jgi:hypothetical protein